MCRREFVVQATTSPDIDGETADRPPAACEPNIPGSYAYDLRKYALLASPGPGEKRYGGTSGNPGSEVWLRCGVTLIVMLCVDDEM